MIEGNYKTNYFVVVFEIQPPDSEMYASPYIRTSGEKLNSEIEKIFKVLNSLNSNFIVKQGAELSQLTTNSTLDYKDFFLAYCRESMS